MAWDKQHYEEVKRQVEQNIACGKKTAYCYMKEYEQMIEKEDYETLEKRLSELEQMAQMMQNMQQGQAEGETSATETPKDDDIIDADFTDKKD